MTETFQSYRFSFEEVCPDQEEIQAFLHSSDLGEDHPVNLFIKEILPRLSDNQEIIGGYVIRPVNSLSVKDGLITIDGITMNTGSQICGYIKEATEVALFLCTAGSVFTSLPEQLNASGDFMEAFVVDTIGSLTVEKAMDKIQKQLNSSVEKEGLKISNRYSPGYCNWPLSEQKTVFSLTGANPTGITLSASCLMTPIKSISGLIGIGADVRKREYGCAICKNTNCIYRKIING